MSEILHQPGPRGDWTDKVWGRTKSLVNTIFYSKHMLETETGGYCSLHYHTARANRFRLISGSVQIVALYGPVVSRVMLSDEGEWADVPSFVPHMFIVYEGGEMLEEYFPDRGGHVRDSDIVRMFEGGKLPVEDLRFLPAKLYNKINCKICFSPCADYNA